MKKYTIDDLLFIFKRHSMEYREKTEIKEDDFLLCDALFLMCQEIKKISRDQPSEPDHPASHPDGASHAQAAEG